MSHDDYVNHIFQKYRLALSISVIRTKPENITLEQYIQLLRSKINEERKNLDDLSISVCSDDFHIETGQLHMNIDENDCNIEDFNDQSVQYTDDNMQQTDINCGELIGLSINIEDFYDNNQTNEAVHTKNYDIYDQNEIQDIELMNTQDLNESITILQNFEKETTDLNNTTMETDQRKSLEDVMDILKSIDDNMMTIEKAISIEKSTNLENSETQASERTDTIKYGTDNDGTLCKSLEIISNAEKYRFFQEQNYNFTNNQSSNHKDRETENNIQLIAMNPKPIVDCKLTNMNQKTNQCTSNITELGPSTSKMETKSINDKQQNELNLESNLKLAVDKQSKIRDYRHTKGLKNIYQNVANIFDVTKSKNAEQDTKVHNSNNVMSDKYQHNISSETQDVVMSTPDDFKCTHYSESQANDLIVIDDRFIHGTNKNKQQNKNVNQITVFEKDMRIDNDIFSQETEKTNISALLSRNYKTKSSTKEVKNDRDNEKHIKRKTSRIDNDISSQDSLLPNFLTSSKSNSQHCDSYDFKHIRNAEKTYRDVHEDKDFLEDKKISKSTVKYIDNDLFSRESQITNFTTFPNSNYQNLTANSLTFSQDAQKIEEYFDQFRIQKSQDSIANNDRTKDLLNKGCTGLDKNLLVNHQIERDENTENIHVHRTIQHNKNFVQVKDHETCDNFDNNLDNTQVTEITSCIKLNEKINSMPVTETCNNFDDNLEDIELEEEMTDSQIEVIPFKVIEELNKVKVYLNKRNEKKLSLERYSSDTGYKSDSQSRHSFKISQSSSIWLDQSAHCIFNYILECPLMDTIQDITNEISAVLGQLIDKLHNEEKYPSFLEDLLESVQSLLRLAYEDNSDENLLMKKEEIIQRILLLNKSIHIQKYTIEKITCLLDNLHTELTTNDSTFEIQNIDKLENICYIFHILETILQKYNKISQNLSQNTVQSNSQEEDKVLKKSNIMDIWKKKWNPNYKENQNEGSSEKTCSLSNCNAVLNKLIVDCMDGYSLISYFALKCFNVMQI